MITSSVTVYCRTHTMHLVPFPYVIHTQQICWCFYVGLYFAAIARIRLELRMFILYFLPPTSLFLSLSVCSSMFPRAYFMPLKSEAWRRSPRWHIAPLIPLHIAPSFRSIHPSISPLLLLLSLPLLLHLAHDEVSLLCPWVGENPSDKKCFCVRVDAGVCNVIASSCVALYVIVSAQNVRVAQPGLWKWQISGLCCHSRRRDDILVRGLRDRKADTTYR